MLLRAGKCRWSNFAMNPPAASRCSAATGYHGRYPYKETGQTR